ncbi:hypothetical protein Lal_00035558 [Lupinus albus]|nr:hypothetical protein Lal_00035558 [Lupinus albus]
MVAGQAKDFGEPSSYTAISSNNSGGKRCANCNSNNKNRTHDGGSRHSGWCENCGGGRRGEHQYQ